MPDDTVFEVFMDLHRGLPRQGPGSAATTERLLDLALTGRDPSSVRGVVDLGCGPGASLAVLARRLPEARLLGVDLHEPFLEELRGTVAADGVSDRVSARVGDMGDLGFLERPADLLWCEAAVYCIGFDAALAAWRPHLAPDGRLVLTEIEWTAEPSEAARTFWDPQYPPRDEAGNRQAAEAAGYEVLDRFLLPEEDWWAEYYRPLLDRMDAVAEPTAAQAAVHESMRGEITLRREHGDEYGYAGYVLAPRAD